LPYQVQSLFVSGSSWIKICNKNVRKIRDTSSIKVVQFYKIKLAVAPLSEKMDRYLWIYLEPSASYEEIIP
jgi:heptaprenylglyceryl phosphate synthase